MYGNDIPFKELVGKVLTDVQNTGDEILFTLEDGSGYKLYHDQDCCEHVSVDDVNGDLTDLIGSPILLAEERSSQENPPGLSEERLLYQDSFTWTFYTLATVKGYVDIRFYGESNGYYSESVSFCKTPA